MQNYERETEILRALRLRPVTSEDEPFLLNLFATTRSDELAFMNVSENQKQAFIAMQFRAQSRQYAMTYPHARNSIILWNDNPIGRILFDRGELEFTLVDIALLPTHRGNGIGTSIIQDLLKQAAAARKPIRLHVLTSSAAKRLYERLGFSLVGGDVAYLEMMWVLPFLDPAE